MALLADEDSAIVPVSQVAEIGSSSAELMLKSIADVPQSAVYAAILSYPRRDVLREASRVEARAGIPPFHPARARWFTLRVDVQHDPRDSRQSAPSASASSRHM